MKKITELTDVELKEIYDRFFFDEETEEEFYLNRDGYGGVEMGQDDNSGMEVRMTDNGSIYLYCCDNSEIYDSEKISELIPFLRGKEIFPFCL